MENQLKLSTTQLQMNLIHTSHTPVVSITHVECQSYQNPVQSNLYRYKLYQSKEPSGAGGEPSGAGGSLQGPGGGGWEKLYEPTHTASENLKKLLPKWSHNPTGDRQLTWSQTAKSVMTCKRSIGLSQTPLTEHQAIPSHHLQSIKQTCIVLA